MDGRMKFTIGAWLIIALAFGAILFLAIKISGKS